MRAGDAPWQALARLMERALSARSLPEICFIAANETWQVMPFRQAVFWRISSRGLPKLQTVSGLARLAEDSPNTVWLRRLGLLLHRRAAREPAPKASFLTRADMPSSLAGQWDEFMPALVHVLPLTAPRDGRLLGLLALALDEAPTDLQQELAQRAVAAYGHAWQALAPPSTASARRPARLRLAGWLLAVLAALALLVPVRLSVLAPAEVIALDALAVTAPMDGVVRSFAVRPNQAVAGGALLFTLDDTTLRNRREVALKQLQVARADALAAAQKAFASDASRGELAALNGRVAEREAELAWLDEQVGRIQVRAPAAGVVVFGDVNDWIGKPLVTGERVALLGDPDDAGILIWLPVADAIDIEPGAEIRLFLQVAPLEPLQATLSQTSYQSVLSPDGISSYRLRARFEALTPEQRQLARIGLKGTAKIYGEKAMLGYYLFRRPLAALREWTGW
ncbi:MAG: HlyD family efflux transporter periplasmic adaptor subunit [Lautropia sp.]|nr:HlyD family efflux transporter periplasmic adaptor subunit [Lautropia sp.]